MKLVGCLKDLCGVWSREILILVLLMTIQRCQSETYWAYVPDPPILHPATWEGKEIVVAINDTRLLDPPATQEFQIAHNFLVLDIGKGIPVYFTKNITLEGCLGLLPQGKWISNISPPQQFPPCTKEL